MEASTVLRDTDITLSHGGGGTAMRDLIEGGFTSVFQPPGHEDQARLEHDTLQEPGALLAFTTDGCVVSPPKFPGGDIGTPAVYGIVIISLLAARASCGCKQAVSLKTEVLSVCCDASSPAWRTKRPRRASAV